MTRMARMEQVILNEIECPVCYEHMSRPIILCRSGHNLCHNCKKCISKCPVSTSGRNFALETIVRSAEYPCQYRNFGCASILTLPQIQHEEVCEYRPVRCPLFDSTGVTCLWTGVREDFRTHVTHEHVACNVHEGTVINLNIMYTSNTVIFALSKMFVMSILIKNGAVFYRLNLEGPFDDLNKYKCKHVLLSDDNVITTFVFSPSPKWIEFSGGIFMDCVASTLILNVSIHNT
ncbi:hypothetical protein B7P43_G05820 [Cryptotermes secundus]|uniref:RING-type E3 ubiquitin transferase n=1 Tax=Cryptotermes secundus TaxID=105785 RepID=A0A2J7QN64_9NEOP|nr:hypothetical protein B7P43_G05820 [Cryptotermes secundus]